MLRFAKGKPVNGTKSQNKQTTQPPSNSTDNGSLTERSSDDIMALTHDVNCFSNALTKLKESIKNRNGNKLHNFFHLFLILVLIVC